MSKIHQNSQLATTLQKPVRFIGVLWGFIFIWWETIFFGGNFFPMSADELFCDLTGLLIIVLALGFNQKNVNN